MTVPGAISAVPASRTPYADAVAPARRTRRGGGLRVLVAEDNPVNQAVVLRVLERHGCHADVVSDGRAAVEAFRRLAYDLVLMDCEMREMDGFDATRAIRAAEAATPRRVPIIAVTANRVPGTRERCVGVGMDDYVSKPIVIEVFDAMLVRWLGPAARAASLVTDATGVLDVRVLAELEVDGMPGFLAELIALFTEDATRHLEGLRAAVASDDPRAVTRVAHALKGSSATLGARSMAALCQEIETAGRAGRAAELAPQVELLARQTQDVLRALALVG